MNVNLNAYANANKKVIHILEMTQPRIETENNE